MTASVNENRIRGRRLTALTAALILLAFSLFSVLFIAVHADHECTGADCPVCACISACDGLLRSMHGMALICAACAELCALFAAAFRKGHFFGIETPILQKVRLNN